MKFIAGMLFTLSFSIAAQAATVVSCDQGALIVTTSNEANRFDITVANKQISRFFISSIRKESPNAVTGVVVNNNGTVSIKSAQLTKDGKSFVTSQFGPSLTAQAEGARLVINSFRMTSSHSYDSHVVADWSFTSCTKNL